jgi:hypothetical protein
MRPRLATSLLGLLLLCAAAPEERIERLSRQVREGKDPRLRAQAALLLAASGDKRGVEPLCAALDDSASLVRLSAAKGLGKLADKAARPCLEKHRDDPDSDAREEIEIASVLVGATPRKPKLYVAFHEVKPASGGADAALLKFAEAELRQKLVRMGAMFAPAGESRQGAAAVLRDKQIKGYMLSVNLEVAGDVVALRLMCAAYPENKMLGQVSIKGRQASREEIVRGIAPALLDDAAQEFGWSQR